MIPQSFHRPYTEFQQMLRQMQTEVTQANPDGPALQALFLEVQRYFQEQVQEQIQGEGQEKLDEAIATKVEAIHIEMRKQLRLLAMDVMFLQAARKAITTQQRQAQMRDRLTLLINYCQGITGTPSQEIAN
ncbi:MAG TPA: heterocyst frequency control protein PatD [Chroococcidiopsis sp.]